MTQAYEDRQLTTQQTLQAFEQLADQYVAADTERQRLGLDPNAFAIYTVLQPFLADGAVSLTPTQAQELNALFLAHPDAGWNEQEQRLLRADLYKALRTVVGPTQMIDAANALMKLVRV